MFIIHTFICVFCDHYLFLLQNKYEHLWHQLSDTKRDPWVIIYQHCPTNDSYNSCIYNCLPCSYVTQPFGILQRLIKIHRVPISACFIVQTYYENLHGANAEHYSICRSYGKACVHFHMPIKIHLNLLFDSPRQMEGRG